MKKASYRNAENFGNDAESLITSYFSPGKFSKEMLSDELKDFLRRISVGQAETSSAKVTTIQ